MSEEKKPAAKKPAAPKAAAPKAAAPAPAKKATAPKAASSGKKIKVTQTGSIIGRVKQQEQTLIGLGLNKRHRSKILVDSPEVRGMITAVKHLVKVEDAA
jgi:large subunit ribosomal protein L30